MPNQKKLSLVATLQDHLSKNPSYILLDYTGLPHKTLEAIRTSIHASGGTLVIVKNNLLLIALKQANLPVSDMPLTGPTAVLLIREGDPSSLKILSDKGKELDALPFKWGVWDGEIIDQEKIKLLSNLPGRDQLLAYLVGHLKSPQARLVYALKGNLQKLTVALDEIRKQKSANLN